MEPDGKEDFQKLTELFQQSQIKTYKNIMAEKSKETCLFIWQNYTHLHISDRLHIVIWLMKDHLQPNKKA